MRFAITAHKKKSAVDKRSIPGMSNDRVCEWLGAASKQPKMRNEIRTDRSDHPGEAIEASVLHSRSSTEAWPKKSSVDSSLSNS